MLASRVPLKIAIPLFLIVPITIWLLGTRKYDFMTAKSIPDSELRPDSAFKMDLPDSQLIPEEHQPEPPEMPKIEFGNLQTSPGLDEYRDQAEKGAPALLDLADRLQKAGRVQRAVLAYERVLDSTPLEGPSRPSAEATLENLKVSLPVWNPDPSAATSLTVNISTARDPESLSGAVATLTELIVVGSGNLCQPKFEITTSPAPKANLPSLPVAMWLTLPIEDPEKPSLPVVTLTPSSDEELNERVTRGLYQLLKRRIESIGNLSPPAAVGAEESPESALINRITRLAWKEILGTPFQSLEEGPPAEALEGEENPEASNEADEENPTP